MLQAIKLDGFRCFSDSTPIPLSNLTILAGTNNVGKSTALHALMAFVQSREQNSDRFLRLSGEWVQLGTFKQVLNYNRVRERREFSLGFVENGHTSANDKDVTWTFTEPEDPTVTTAVISRIDGTIGGRSFVVEPNEQDRSDYTWTEDEAEGTVQSRLTLLSPSVVFRHSTTNQSQIEEFSSFDSSRILYLSAYRDPPERIYLPRRSDLGPFLGARGEYTAEALLRFGNTQSVDVLPPNSEMEGPVPLRIALDLWWSYIFGGPYAIRAAAPENLGFTLALDTPSAENLGLGQVGVGLSQALPVIVLGLCTEKRELVAIESPEIHLHPAAQHRLTELFVALARSGRQVILETHSDHIVNAVRLAVKRGRENNGLRPEQVAMHFFTQEKGVGQVERLLLDKSGRLDRWPPGFFDQSSESLMQLIE